MVPNFPRWFVPAALCAATLAAQAQAAVQVAAQRSSTAARPDPLDAQANVTAPAYESPFSRYQRARDDKPTLWRDANETVARIGGWRAYAREASDLAASPAAPMTTDTDKVRPMPPGQGVHKAP